MKKHEVIVDILIKILALLLVLYFILLCIKGTLYSNSDNAYESTESIIENIDSVATREKVDTMTDSDDITSEDTEETFGTLDKLHYIIDVTYVNSDDNTYKGNTSTRDGYSGIIEFRLSDTALDKISIDIEIGNTYTVDASPMIETSTDNLPYITVTNIEVASSDDIDNLEDIRKEVSTYTRKRIEYNSMTLNEIVIDANSSYATWTQDEIKDYISFIDSKGYTDSNDEKSLVCLRDDISKIYNTN